MSASISHDDDLAAVIAVSGPEVTRDSMADAIRYIAAELAAKDSERLIVDMSRSDIVVPVESTTILLDRLLNAVHANLTVALVFHDDQRGHFEHFSNYLEAGMFEVERFSDMAAARRWIAGANPVIRRA